MDDGDKVDEPTDPAMESGELVERELGGVGESEEREGGGFERKENAKGEKGEGDVSGSTSDGPPGLVDGIVGDKFFDLRAIDCALETSLSGLLNLGWGEDIGDTFGSGEGEVIGANEAEDHAEDEDKYEGEELRIGG